MSAIEYGSYYWCVILSEKAPGAPPETVHLHADQVVIDPTGALNFLSKGRRPAGTEPSNAGAKPNGNPPTEAKKDEKAAQSGSMIYFSLAPGTWKLVYAAKLQDGSPASVEHWNAAVESAGAVFPQGAEATDYVPVK
jgi:hypothetical protein